MKKSPGVEVRLLYGTIAATLLAALLLLIAICTDYWLVVRIPDAVYRNSSDSFVLSHHSGLWRICRKEVFNHTLPVVKSTTCHRIKFWPSEDVIEKNLEIDDEILNYSRSETAFALMSLLFSVIAHFFAFWSLREPRYMFKRLAAALYLFTAITDLVAVEVLSQSVDYERENLEKRIPAKSSIHYGFSFVLAWIVFVINLLAAIIFAICSRKRKGDKARSEKEATENEPIHLGRV